MQIRMHFSRVVGVPNEDLALTFTTPLALQWEEEFFGFIELPENLPKCSGSEFNHWVYPTLVIENSAWAERYANRIFTEAELETKGLTHFVFIAMNDLLHVLSVVEPTARFVESVDA